MKKTFLLLFVALIGIGVTLYSKRKSEQVVETANKQRLLYSGAFENLVSFGWTNPPQRIEFEKINGRWWLKHPYSALADTSEVYNIFQGTLARSAEQKFLYTDALKDFKFFESPQKMFWSTAQKTSSFQVGLNRGYGDTIYLLDEQKNVSVMPFDWKSAWEKNVEEFLEKQIIPVELESWTQIEVKSKRYSYVLQRQAHGWHLMSPILCKLNSSGTQWLTELSHLRSIKVQTAGDKIDPVRIAQLEREKLMDIQLTASEKIWSLLLNVVTRESEASEGVAWLRSQSVIHQVFAHSIDQLNLDPRQFCDPVKSK